MQKKITALVALGIGIGAGCFMASSGGAEEIGDPIEFHPGEVARSADVNNNFTKVYDQVNKIGRAVTVDEANSTVEVDGNLKVTGTIEIPEVTGTLSVPGTLEIPGTLKITGGNPGGGKVLASDADGTVFWKQNDGMPLVTSAGGRIWMAKDLGAMRVATKINDAEAYGWLFAYGGLADGHQYRYTPIDATDVGVDYWNDTSTGGTHNPCPAGFRVPTLEEWQTEVASWSSQDAAGAFASPLKLVLSGVKLTIQSPLSNIGDFGSWWSNTKTYDTAWPWATHTYCLTVDTNSAQFYDRGVINSPIPFHLRSVRCIQHQ